MTDLRFAWKSLLKAPRFTLMSVLSIGLGMAAATSIFSFVNGVLLSPLPFRDSEKIVAIIESQRGEPVNGSPARLKDWGQAPGLTAVSGYYGENLTVSLRGVPERIVGVWQFGDLLGTLNTAPALGRNFNSKELEEGGAQVALVSDKFWRRRLAGVAQPVGVKLVVNGQVREVIGVLPAGVEFEEAEIFLPESPTRFGRAARFVMQLARLRPGVELPEARAQLATIAARLAVEYPKTDQALRAGVALLRNVVGTPARMPLYVLFFAVCFVLLMACLNVASLSVSRILERHHELALRQALGAGRARIVGLLLTESALIALAGGVLAVLASVWAVAWLRSVAPAELPRAADVEVNGAVLGFSALLVLATTMISGLAPAIRLSRVDLTKGLQENLRAASSGHRLLAWLAGAQVGLSLALVIGGGLLFRSLWNMEQRPLGFRPEGLISFRFSLPWQTDPKVVNGLYARVLERVRQVPGVENSALMDRLPLDGNAMDAEPHIEGMPAVDVPEGRRLYQRFVSSGLHELIAVPLVQGRYLQALDAEHRSTVINAAAARIFFGGKSPLGRHIGLRWNGAAPRKDQLFEIVGVVADVATRGDQERVEPAMFVSFTHNFWPIASIVVKTRGDAGGTMSALRKAVAEVDSTHAIELVQTMERHLRNQGDMPRLQAFMVTVFAVCALLLAALGMYGLISNIVAKRRREIGIRIALGAEPAMVVRQTLRSVLTPVVGGCVAGLGLAYALARAARALLFGVEGFDPATYAASAALLLLVLLGTAWWPARAASQLDPMEVLRDR